MKIKDLLASRTPAISFEFFPPKTDEGTETLFQTVRDLGRCRPSFVSVTYGAGGSTRDRTLDLVGRIKRELGVEAMAHLTCVGSSKDDVRRILERLAKSGVENVLALRGDPPSGQQAFVAQADGFAYASELVHFIRDEGFPFCVGGACYPEGHVECRDLGVDLANLKHKVDAGVDFLVTQLFFDNEDYFAFVRRARSAGITLPIVPGLMPITNVAQIQRFTQMCGARIPHELRRRMEVVEADPAAVVATGVFWAATQSRELIERGAPGLHYYTLNKSSATLAVHATLGL